MKRADDSLEDVLAELARQGDVTRWRLTIERAGSDTMTRLDFGKGDDDGVVSLTFLESGDDGAGGIRLHWARDDEADAGRPTGRAHPVAPSRGPGRTEAPGCD